MCEFLSWVETKKKIYFLTTDLIYNTPRGELIQKRFPGSGELIGHSAIRAYFELGERGEDKECINFSTPDNFPDIIVGALEEGKLNYAPFYEELLTKTALGKLKADAEWEKADAECKKADAKHKKAYAEWEKAYAEWEKAYAEWEKASAEWEKADAKHKKAYAEWEKASAEWEKADAKCKKAYAECKKVNSRLGWKLFMKPQNRNPKWR